MAKFLTLCLCLTFLVLIKGDRKPLKTRWAEWKDKYSKVYSNQEEDSLRYKIWRENLAFVTQHNKQQFGFQLELNQFADQHINGRTPNLKYPRTNKSSPLLFFGNNVPDAFDWRKKGAVSPVKNQGQLGDAVAYAATDSIYSLEIIKSGKMTSPSVFEVADCCGRLSWSQPFMCIKNIGGLCSTEDYPALAKACKNNSCTAKIHIQGGHDVPRGDEKALQAAVCTNPVYAVIDASHTSFQLYQSGIYYEPNCSTSRLDHAVLIVGYGALNGKEFWIVKNSWGASWGMNGYILMSRNRKNNCGIASAASYPY